MESQLPFCLQEPKSSLPEALQEQADPMPAGQALRGLANSDAAPTLSEVTSRSDSLPIEGDVEVRQQCSKDAVTTLMSMALMYVVLGSQFRQSRLTLLCFKLMKDSVTGTRYFCLNLV